MRSEVWLGVDASEQATLLGTGGNALLLSVVVFPFGVGIILVFVVVVDSALIDIVFAVTFDGAFALRCHFLVGAGADFVLEGSSLAHQRSLAQILSQRAALQRVGLEGAGGVLVGRATQGEHGLLLLAHVQLGRRWPGDKASRRLQDGSGVEAGA